MPRRTRADPVARAFGRAVREQRRRRNETLEDIAGRVEGLDPKYLGEIERGWHAPTITTAKRLAEALETPLTHLVRGI